MTETEVMINGPAGVLAGTLSEPATLPRAVVIFLHGTGPMDRDENLPGQALNVFNTIAKALVDSGWASFRYDKRGCGKSAGDYQSAGHFDLVADARAVIAALRARRYAQIVLMGHSEGTLLAAELAASADGLVLLAPFVTSLRALLMGQAEQMQRQIDSAPGLSGWFSRRVIGLFGGAVALQRRLITKLDTTKAPVIRFMGRKVTAKSLREMLSLDIAEIYQSVRVPVLAVSGGKDIQCPPGDGARIADLTGGESLLIADLTHLLRLSDHDPGFGDYVRQLGQPVDPEMIGQVTAWLNARWSSRGDAHG